MADHTRTTRRSIVPCMFIVDGPAGVADFRAAQLAEELNTLLRDREDAGEPRTKLYLCEGSPTTELTIDEAQGGDPHTLAGLTCDSRAALARVNTERIDVLAVMDEAAGILGGETFVCGRDMIAARAAVAELIEAVTAFRSDQSTAALQRLSAALARVQGGAA